MDVLDEERERKNRRVSHYFALISKETDFCLDRRKETSYAMLFVIIPLPSFHFFL